MLQNAVHYSWANAGYGEKIPEAIRCQLSYPHARRAEPHVSLIVNHDIIHRIIELHFVNNMKVIQHIKIAHAIFRSYQQNAISSQKYIVDSVTSFHGQQLQHPYCPIFYAYLGHFVPRGAHPILVFTKNIGLHSYHIAKAKSIRWKKAF